MRPNSFHLSLILKSPRSDMLEYPYFSIKPLVKLFTPVIFSPGLLGAQKSFIRLADSGSQRACGILLPGNGVTLTDPSAFNTEVQGSLMVRILAWPVVWLRP